MSTDAGLFQVPPMTNEPACAYAPGTKEEALLRQRLRQMEDECLEIPSCIGGQDVWTARRSPAVMPHRKEHVLGHVHQCSQREVADAIDAARGAWHDWHRTPWTERAAIFLRAAALASGPLRETLNAATMLGQSKTIDEADADAACELADFFRLNVSLLPRIYGEQPASDAAAWNRVDYRPLEGFVFAVTPFNFTAIAANLPSSAALMGNTVVWKPAATATLSAYYVMKLLREAGLPDGVVNLVYGDGATVASQVLASQDLAGVHFTGSTAVLRSLWTTVGANIHKYAGYPRIVGETGGKDFILAHESADAASVLAAVIRGAFEYQGQKCSAVSRLFVPRSLWATLREGLVEEIKLINVGDVTDRDVYMGAVINADSYARQTSAIAEAKDHGESNVLAGGTADDRVGYFVGPTLIETTDPGFRLLRDELFGPVVTAYVFPDGKFDDVLRMIDSGAPYGLTGSIFSEDRAALSEASEALRYAAGNLYLNDKPTGAVVGQQPFGGSRASGTNDKVGSIWHLSRWVSPRCVKDRHLAPVELRHRTIAADRLQGNGFPLPEDM